MSFGKRCLVILLIVAMTVGIIYTGKMNNEAVRSQQKENSIVKAETLYFWYSDDTYTSLFMNAAVDFNAQNPDVVVVPVLVSGIEYLEYINECSLGAEDFPDLFLLSNDSLEKAYLAGLASKIDTSINVVNEVNFPNAALKAVTYKDNYVAYPYTYETSVLLYNKTILENMAKTENEEGNAGSNESLTDEEIQALIDSGEDIDQIELNGDSATDSGLVSYEDYIPKTINDIRTLATEHNAPEGVESFFKWDVTDIFYNYFFAGNYLSVGGEAGDDSSIISIYNDDTAKCLEVYQNLSSFFSIDADESSYEKVLQDFVDGKVIFTIATSDAISSLNVIYEEKAKEREALLLAKEEEERLKAEALAQAEITVNPDEERKDPGVENAEKEIETEIDAEVPFYEYAFATLPDLDEEYKTRAMSITNALVINGYSEKKSAANRFASFLSTSYAGNIFDKTGKLAAYKGVNCDTLSKQVFMQEYSYSVPLSKIVESSNLWVELEITFTDIWKGGDIAEKLSALDQQITSQITN